MASYKVPADISGDDNLIGGLSFKQFVFAMIAVAILGVGWVIGRGTTYFVIAPFLIPAAPFIFLAAPLRKDQPNDVWLAARLRFYFKPRVRRWDQSGTSNFVTITVPKREAHIYTDGMTRSEVSSKLESLALTIDSRGWSSKNQALNLGDPRIALSNDERLVSTDTLPQEVSDIDIKPWEDIFDGEVSQHMQTIIADRSHAYTDKARQNMMQAEVEPMLSEEEILDKIHTREHAKNLARTHEKIVAPVGEEDKFAHLVDEPKLVPLPSRIQQQNTLDPDIISRISEENSDVKVSTIAAIADREQKRSSGLIEAEGVINLH